ncbi:MAG: hypothetical protein U9Q06_00945 [Nanoarchaeota archaeon]|nr:hypothetical protein [Nanoarchaeota archaeon]
MENYLEPVNSANLLSFLSSFKPGISDKIIFNQIIEDNLDDLVETYFEKDFNAKHLAFGLMLQEYYPIYGTFDRRQQNHN